MQSRTVPMVDLVRQHAELRPLLDKAISSVIDSGRFILGPEVSSFETELAAACNSRYAIGTASGTDALLVSLMALGIGSGDQVITTAFSFFATAGVIARLGATPVFVDIEPETFNIDPSATQERICDKTAAILPVNLYGRLATLPSTEMPIIEDAAQSIGSKTTRGLASCYSFFPTKNIGALGDAGAVVSNDESFADTVKLLRTHGGRPKYVHKVVGGNFRIDAMQAAVLRIKLAHLRQWTLKRRENANTYRELFANASTSGDVVLPSDCSDHVYHQFTIRVPRRDELRAWLTKQGISTEVYYPFPLHLQECFSHLGYRPGQLPFTESAAAEALSLPIHPQLQPGDQEYVVKTISEFYQ